MIRHAMVTDVPPIAGLIAQYARHGKMLFRSHAELYETLRDFLVYEAADSDAETPKRIIGVCALEIVWADLAEIKSLAVEAGFQGRGIGGQLVEAVIQEALALRIQRVFALTYEQRFFTKRGFHVVAKSTLPLKVWSDCVQCPKRDGCDEIAMVRELMPQPALEELQADQVQHQRYEVPTELVRLNIRHRGRKD
ncbi:MAG: N-acetyltransferase [Phycisphaerae bacterium]